jgi:hypothetical protein
MTDQEIHSTEQQQQHLQQQQLAENQPFIPIHVQWSAKNEQLLVEWADIAQCYRWMAVESLKRYERYHLWFTMPIITLSTITGTASFAISSNPSTYGPMVIGSINIFIGILGTVQQYLKISELKEAYRVAVISWDKVARNIRIELAKHPDERTECYSFLKQSRTEFERLIEVSPSISDVVIQKFKTTFKDQPDFQFINIPDICNKLVSTDSKRHEFFKGTLDLETGLGGVYHNRNQSFPYFNRQESRIASGLVNPIQVQMNDGSRNDSPIKLVTLAEAQSQSQAHSQNDPQSQNPTPKFSKSQLYV